MSSTPSQILVSCYDCVVNGRSFPLLLPTLTAGLLMLVATPALAGQGTVPNPPAAMAPGATSTAHEIGASLNGNLNPDSFIPAFNWRVHFPSTGTMGPLSGLFLGLNVGPAVNFHGRSFNYGRSYRDIWGRGGFELGYEIAPWSNLALTFSPVIHNDFHFSPYFFQFTQTFGPAIRLYIDKHWVVYFEPGFVGWNIWTDGDGNTSRPGFSVRGGVGFAYKF